MSSRIASKPAQTIRLAYATTNVTSAAYVQLTAGINADAHIIMAEILESGGNDLKLAIGAAGAEVDVYSISGNHSGHIPFHVEAGTRLSVKAYGTSNTTGSLILNLFD